ncbi:hypothetical protein [Lactobacillus helveticus]|uniref:hypothetical protein n=1 Tax=Lactobacillus helveticus TaxID=1587 RepID=UPI001C644E55|nr:hypothetical protein [Lactobacillus helveticus]MBW7988274.1 hypothetical protein [Lactobacillus helveticus]
MLAEYTSYYDMLTAHKKNIQNDNTKLLCNNEYKLELPTNSDDVFLKISSQVKDKKKEDYYDVDMYKKSRIMKRIQSVFTFHTVCLWNDSVLKFTPKMKLYDTKKIHEEKIQTQKKKELIEYKKDREIIPKLKKQFSNQNYKITSSRKKIYKIEHLLDNAKKLRTDHISIYMIFAA